MKFLVTGGCGYIGSHTIVDLLEKGHEVVSIDNYENCFTSVLKGIQEITGKRVKNYDVDLCDLNATQEVFNQESDIQGIIHFAAKKYVNESVEKPLDYYHNNIEGLINVLSCCKQFNIKHLVFSSSCSVYGNSTELPVHEEVELAKPESPYAHTKLIGEQLIKDFIMTYPLKATLLRYFNPIGTHKSLHIGERAKQASPNLMPRIIGTALGQYESFEIAGSDYPTSDGTCVRDYIHVMDIADAHTKAIKWLVAETNESICEVFNLGSGNGVSVLEMVKAFEQANQLKLNYKLSSRREGDVVAIYADNSKAKKVLGWDPQYSLEEMMRSAWEWEKKVNAI
jgi:UDP-glucose 4-epimerase